LLKDFQIFFTVRKLTKFTGRYLQTFSTTPLKCCHFTLQNVKRNNNISDKLITHYSTFKINQTEKIGQII